MPFYTIITKKNSSSGSIPNSASLQIAELALNDSPLDGGLFFKDISGSVRLIRAGTASLAWTALTASYLLGTIESASYALTASAVLGSIQSASFASNAATANSATTATNATTAATASYLLGSIATASVANTAVSSSFAFQAISSSFANNSINSVFSISASHALISDFTVSSSYAMSSSWADKTLLAISASWALSASYAEYGRFASMSLSSSFAYRAQNVDYAATASYVPGMGSGSGGGNTVTASYALMAEAVVAGTYASLPNNNTFYGTNIFTADTSFNSNVFTQFISTNVPSASSSAWNVSVGTDAGVRFFVYGSGMIGWGSGLSGTPDTTFYRMSSASLKIDGRLSISSLAGASGSFVLVGSGGLLTTGNAPNPVSASYALTASYASSVPNPVSASYALTASYARRSETSAVADVATSATNAVNAATASYIVQALSASVAVTASYVSPGTLILSASYASTASVATSASYALTASYAPTGGTSVSASYSTTASFATTSSYSFNGVSSSYALTSSYASNSGIAISASYATTASFATTSSYSVNGVSASYALTASYASNGSSGTSISASYAATASIATSASYAGTSSLSTSSSYAATSSLTTSASYALTASYALNGSSGTSVSSSYSTTASFSATSSYIATASFALSASNSYTASVATSSSYALTASYSTTASFSTTSSYSSTASLASNSISSSYAVTASYALNGGGVGTPITSGAFSIWDSEVVISPTSALDDEFSSGSNLDPKWITSSVWSGLTSYSVNSVKSGSLWIRNNSTGINLRAIMQVIPAGDFTIITKFTFNSIQSNWANIGLLLANGPTGGLQTSVAIRTGGSVVQRAIVNWNNYTGFTADVYTTGASTLDWTDQLVRVRRSGSTYTAGWSSDGATWFDYTFSPSATPTYFGLLTINESTALEVAFDYFRYFPHVSGTVGGLRTVITQVAGVAGSSVSASYALTASYAVTSSYAASALSASWAPGVGGSSLGTGSFFFSASQVAYGATLTGSTSVYRYAKLSNINTSLMSSRVRIYRTAAARDTDLNRIVGAEPRTDSGLAAEFVLVNANTRSINTLWPVDVMNGDVPRTNTWYWSITNYMNVQDDVSVTGSCYIIER